MNSPVPENAPGAGGPPQWLLLAAYLLALVVPPLWVISWTPSPTLLNQLWALGGWGAVLLLHRCYPPSGARRYPVVPLNLALGLVCCAILGSWSFGSLPTSLALPPLGCVVVAAGCAALGARVAACAGADAEHLQAFEPFAWGVFSAGVLSAVVSVIQYFFPDRIDGGVWIAVSGLPGRAVGNLRQPNHLASLLIWAAIALVPLAQWRRFPMWLAGCFGALLIFGVLLSGSRTGLYAGVGLLAAWGLADALLLLSGRDERRLSPALRWMLILSPLVAAALWWGLDLQAEHAHHVFGAKERLAEKDSSHLAIWKNTLAMIAQQPWRGVGWGQFNFAWTLTPFPDRPTAFFDHTHDLPLQLAVELGVPLASAVFGLMLLALYLGMRRSFELRGPAGHGARAAWMMVVMIGIHSLDEYPLWYSYFLLPAAWAWGFSLGSGRAPRSASREVMHGTEGSVRAREVEETNVIRLSSDGIVLRTMGAVMLAVSAAAAADYFRVSTIFMEVDDPPLAERIGAGQRSLLFAHHADYADATTSEPPSRALGALERATHSLLDARLMIAWANALAESGQFDRARYVAARLREFRKADADEFFAPCNALGGAAAVGKAPASAAFAVVPPTSAARVAAHLPASQAHGPTDASEPDVKKTVKEATTLPFQCEAPSVPLNWRDFE